MKKDPSSTSSRLIRFGELLGDKGMLWLLIGVVSTLILSFVEYGVAGFLQLFLFNLGYVDAKNLPSFLSSFQNISIQTLCAILLFIGIARSLALFFSGYGNQVVQELVNERLRLITIYEMLLTKGKSFLSAAEVQNRMGDTFPKARHWVFSAINLFVTATQCLFLLVGMVWVTWKESLIGLAGLGAAGLLVLISNKIVEKNSEQVPEVQKQISKDIERVSRNWLLVRISRTESLEHFKLLRRISDYYHFVIKASYHTNVMMGLPPLFGIMLFAMIILLSRITFHTNPSSLVIFLFLFLRLIQNLGTAAQHFGQTSMYLPQFRIATRIFFALPANERVSALNPGKEPETQSVQRSAESRPPTIHIQNLTYSWKGSQKKIFNQFTFEIKAGSIIGIVGPSGSGKSTLMHLILGIIEPESGKIDIEKKSPTEYFAQNADRLGYVGAEPFLIEGTLKENLLYGCKFVVTESEIYNALKKVHLFEHVDSLPQKLDYHLNENGAGLSTGQKQRLSLARALIRSPLLLILDEVSANLDDATETEIALTIAQLKTQTTVVIVSHRPGILKACDQTLKL